MQIQLNTDNHIEGNAKLAQYVEDLVESTVGWMGKQITRVEVQLHDENSSKKDGGDDKRCVMEARLAGLKPISVTHQADTVDQALDGAVGKLEKALKKTLDRLRDTKKGRKPIAEEPND